MFINSVVGAPWDLTPSADKPAIVNISPELDEDIHINNNSTNAVSMTSGVKDAFESRDYKSFGFIHCRPGCRARLVMESRPKATLTNVGTASRRNTHKQVMDNVGCSRTNNGQQHCLLDSYSNMTNNKANAGK